MDFAVQDFMAMLRVLVSLGCCEGRLSVWIKEDPEDGVRGKLLPQATVDPGWEWTSLE